MRKFFFSVIILLLFCLIPASAYADAALFKGSGRVGAVRTAENNGYMCVPVEDTGRLLGFTSSRNGEEISLSRGNVSLRVISGSAAAWRGMSIIPLHSAPFERDGVLWLDAQSAVALFQGVAGSGTANKLRFARTSGYTVTVANADSDIEFGKFDEPKPAVDLSAIMSRTSRPNPQPSLPSQTVQTAQAPAITTAQAIPQEQPVISASSSKHSEPSSSSQPKYETFKPNDRKTEKGEYYSGTVQGIRWTSQEGSRKKIRAVIMADEGADPQVYMNGGELHALFSSSIENSVGIASPFTNVTADIKRTSGGIDLVFYPKGITKAEKYVLDNPRRIALDFFFPSSVNIAGTSPANNNNSNIRLPGQVAQSKPQPQPQIQIPSQSTQRTDPVISQTAPVITNLPPSERRTRSPAVTTLPSTITIPTSPQAANRLGSGRTGGVKTIVIDPGHGGKDPGASANGVTEKNVNLAVGLELQRVLAAKGYNVIMTRATDVYLKLQERTDIANNVNADLFVSVHVNALPNKKSMTGFEIYIMALPTDKDAMNLAKIENREYVEGKGMDTANVDRRTEMLLHILGDMQQNNKISESTDFAAALYNAGVRGGLPMKRVAQAPFFVLRGAGMPAVLLEIGFVTNASESRLLTTQAYQQKIANAMSDGIANYLR